MKKKTVGVIIGRFQVPSLHEGHVALINKARNENDHVLIVLGSSTIPYSKRDPLPVGLRAGLFSGAKVMANLDDAMTTNIVTLTDHESDEVWSKDLDALVTSSCPGKVPTLYCGRDGFVKHYVGKYKVKVFDSKIADSGTDIRTKLAARDNDDFRSGVIFGIQNQYPHAFMTVDIAVTKENKQVLLGRKPESDQWRFPGGFVDPKDVDLAYAASRELSEEVPEIDVGGSENMEYITSMIVNDWRYKNSPDKIMTALFHATYTFGPISAGDDLEEVRWFSINNSSKINLWLPHRPLLNALLDFVSRRVHDEKIMSNSLNGEI